MLELLMLRHGAFMSGFREPAKLLNLSIGNSRVSVDELISLGE
jgi:hypothetical protein